MNVRRFAQSAIAMAIAGAISHSAIAQEVIDKGIILSIGASYNALDSYRCLSPPLSGINRFVRNA